MSNTTMEQPTSGPPAPEEIAGRDVPLVDSILVLEGNSPVVQNNDFFFFQIFRSLQMIKMFMTMMASRGTMRITMLLIAIHVGHHFSSVNEDTCFVLFLFRFRLLFPRHHLNKAPAILFQRGVLACLV